MNIKLLLGIFIPLLIIISLIILSSINIGSSIEKETEKSIKFDSLFADEYQTKNNIPVQTITLKNDYFLPKRYELPRLLVCLNDKEGIKGRENLEVRYSEGRYSYGTDIPLFEDVYHDYYYSYESQSVEIPANGKRQVKIFIIPKYMYGYPDKNSFVSYKEYDEILLVQPKKSNRYDYTYCGTLDSKELENALHIAIVDKPPTKPKIVYCTDSDGGKEPFVRGEVYAPIYSTGIKGIIVGENPNRCSDRWDATLDYSVFYDCCVNSATSKELNEGYCGSENGASSTFISCEFGCRDGVCIRP